MLPTCPYCKEEMAFFYYQNVFICINDKCEGKKKNEQMSNEKEIICYECQSNKNPNPITFCEVLKAVYRRAKRDKIQN